jgi:glycerol-3-phosphate dehydrogenase
MRYIITKCRDLVPSFDIKEVIHTFAGARAKNSTGDWVIGISHVSPHFINVAGIDSPGLAGSPAIALEVVRLLKEEAGLNMIVNEHFNPIRAPIIIPKDGWRGIKVGPVGKIQNSKENVICKCEKVTEYEVITALHRSLPIDSTQAIRKRTRAGMGVCQGDVENYNCECRVADVIARETGLPPSAVGRRPWPATSSLPSRWLTDEQKEDIAKTGMM